MPSPRRTAGSRYVELRGVLFRLNDESYRAMLLSLVRGNEPNLHTLGSYVTSSVLNITGMPAAEASRRLVQWDQQHGLLNPPV